MTARTVSELAVNRCYDVELLGGVTMFVRARYSWACFVMGGFSVRILVIG